MNRGFIFVLVLTAFSGCKSALNNSTLDDNLGKQGGVLYSVKANDLYRINIDLYKEYLNEVNRIKNQKKVYDDFDRYVKSFEEYFKAIESLRHKQEASNKVGVVKWVCADASKLDDFWSKCRFVNEMTMTNLKRKFEQDPQLSPRLKGKISGIIDDLISSSKEIDGNNPDDKAILDALDRIFATMEKKPVEKEDIFFRFLLSRKKPKSAVKN